MLDRLLGNARWPIAVDIGADSVRLLQLRPSGGTLAARACARRQLPSAPPRGAEGWREMVVSTVRELLRRGPFRGRGAVSALSFHELKVKNIRLPAMPEEEMAEAVRWEAQERFGCELGADQLHYLHAGQVRQGNDSYEEVILLAAMPEAVEAHYTMLEEMGLNPLHIEAEPVALYRAFGRHLRRRADEDAVAVVLDLGGSGTRIVVGRGRRIVLIKKIDVGGRRLGEAVARQLGISYEEARDLRSQISRDRRAEGQEEEAGAEGAGTMSWTILDALRGEVEGLAREIALCLRYCSVTFRGLRPNQATLTGGGAYDGAVVKLLGEQLGVECHVGQPLRGVDTSAADFGGDRRGMLPEWCICAGLALRGAESQRVERKSQHERDRLPA